jgi:hypothetical protein
VSLNIALDFDDTYTEDPELWDRFIGDAQRQGHTMFICTARNQAKHGGEIESVFPGLEVIYSNGGKKREAMQRENISVSVWIDDMPELI